MNRLALTLLLALGLAFAVMAVIAQTGTATEATTQETSQETTQETTTQEATAGSTITVTIEGRAEETEEATEEAEEAAAPATTEAAGDETRTLAAIVREDADLSTLLEALEAAGLLQTLDGEGSFTLFAPTNEAFEAFQEDGEDLSEVLQYHVAEGRMTSDFIMDLPDGTTLVTLEGSLLTVTFDNGTVMVDDATVMQTGLRASNGVIHVIDRVLTPSMLYMYGASRPEPREAAEDEVDDTGSATGGGDTGGDTGGGDTGGDTGGGDTGGGDTGDDDTGGGDTGGDDTGGGSD